MEGPALGSPRRVKVSISLTDAIPAGAICPAEKEAGLFLADPASPCSVGFGDLGSWRGGASSWPLGAALPVAPWCATSWHHGNALPTAVEPALSLRPPPGLGRSWSSPVADDRARGRKPAPPPPAAPLSESTVAVSSLDDADKAKPQASAAEGNAGSRPLLLPRSQTLALAADPDGGTCQVQWTVEARKLGLQDRQAVSPEFSVDLPELGPTPFKIALYPKAAPGGKQGGGFKRTKGRGRIELKCERQLQSAPGLLLSFQVGSGGRAQPPRGPVEHDFSEHSCAGLPKGNEDWDFSSAVDESEAFVVTLEIEPNGVLSSQTNHDVP